MLVDGDLRKPTMHYTFQATNTMGLTNVLTRQATLMEAVQATDVEKLDLLSSGPIPPNPAELLSSRMMDQMLAEAYKQYDLVIFDSPPVLAVTDAQVLANQCQGTVLVVKSGETELENALKAKELLETAKAKLLGAVLNNKSMKESSYYYYYGRK